MPATRPARRWMGNEPHVSAAWSTTASTRPSSTMSGGHTLGASAARVLRVNAGDVLVVGTEEREELLVVGLEVRREVLLRAVLVPLLDELEEAVVDLEVVVRHRQRARDRGRELEVDRTIAVHEPESRQEAGRLAEHA